MVVGILTVHSQINYGAILQTYALQNILEKKGYKVVVLDRIMDKKTGPLLGAISNGGFLCWMRILVRGSIGLWDFAEIKRRIKSHLFIKKHLNLSSFKFKNWVDAPMDIGVDLLVLGSDQIWNTKHHDPHVFLLDGAPRLPAITYAASFGTKDIDVKYEELFKERIHSFDDISVREEYAKDILKRFNVNAIRVMDPTIAVSTDIWDRFVKKGKGKSSLVCYLIAKPSYDQILLLQEFAIKNSCVVKIFVGSLYQAMPKRIDEWKEYLNYLCISFSKHIKFAVSHSPKDFVDAFANADYVITSTFHGLMFASIFRKQVRVLKEPFEDNPAGFRRLHEFINYYMNGDVVQYSFKDALDSIFSGEKICYKEDEIQLNREKSINWLGEAVKKAVDRVVR